jgi:hypothetical protein
MAARSRSTRGGPAATASRRSGRPKDDLLYLYCIVEAGTPAHQVLGRRTLPGLDPGSPLFPIESGDLVAAVSRVPADIFQEDPLNALVADLPRLAPYALRHEEAVRALLNQAPALLPMAFGAVYQGTQGVVALLGERAADLRQRLDLVRGKQEWGLKVFRDLPRSTAAAETESELLRNLAAEIAQATPGRAYLLRKKSARLLASEADQVTRDALDAIMRNLADISVVTRQDPIAAEPAGAIRLVLKAAFLVEAARVNAFRSQADELQSRYQPLGLSIEASGPWAPYSFVGDRNDGL